VIDVRILVVDDEAAVRESLSRTLRFEGYDVDVAGDGVAAIDEVRRQEPDAVILDVMMPRLDGLEACRRWRADGLLLPVLMLTARDSVGDRVAGLDAGADDYLIKLFALQELLARLRALLRRSLVSAPATGLLRFADLTLNPDTREVRRGEREVRLTRTEFTILEVFLRHPRGAARPVRGPGVTFEVRAAPSVISGRPVALERMVLNLLDNAAKWGPPTGTVHIELRGDADIAVLTVADAGPGIDPADLPHVFERFYRATAARAMPGSGLGLAIVAQTVAQHRGTVTAGRSATGGALLTVRLPVSSDS